MVAETKTLCLTDETLFRFANGHLEGAALEDAESHLDGCAACRALAVAAAEGFAATTLNADQAQPVPSAPLTPGRYHPIELLGRGGMGAVYRAYDPVLMREVALKLVSLVHMEGTDKKDATGRLLREAQALAKLSHPHIVTVFDVGSLGDDVFLAMERVRGATLKTWLAGNPPASEVLRIFAAAGEGLAAAHDGGVVHRDFKPENVMLSDEGVVKVLDFGLARIGPVPRPPDEARDPEQTQLDSCFMGTPGYMAPEQASGEKTGPRTDQYSFCVALYEALYGRPAIDASYRLVRPLAFPSKPGVSNRVRAAIERGLSDRPADRYPTMRDLLQELAPPKKRLARAAVLIGAVLAGSALAFALLPADEEACTGGAENFAGVWDDAAQQRLRSAFASARVIGEQDLWNRVRGGLDAYRANWLATHRTVCRATEVLGQQSAGALDDKMHCLSRQLVVLDAWLDQLAAKPTRDAMHNAVKRVDTLQEPSLCDADAKRFAPRNDTERADYRRFQETIAKADAKVLLGEFSAGLSLAKSAVTIAEGLAPGPRAEALHTLGRLQYEDGDHAAARDTFLDATKTAARAGRQDLQATLWLDLLRAYTSNSQSKEAIAIAELIEATFGDTLTEEQHAALLARSAEALRSLGRRAEAESQFRRAVEALHEPSILLAHAHRGLGQTLAEAGDVGGAEREYRYALELYEQVLGPDHPDTAIPKNSLVNLYRGQKRFDEAQGLAEEVLAHIVKTQGENHPRAAVALSGLASMKLATNDLEGAKQDKIRALRILETAYENKAHDHIAKTNYDIGAIAFSQGRPQEAVVWLMKAAETAQKGQGEDSPLFAYHLSLLAVAHATLGQSADALRASEHAVKVGHPEPRRRAYLYYRRMRVLSILGRDDDAKEPAKKALELFPPQHNVEREEAARVLGLR